MQPEDEWGYTDACTPKHNSHYQAETDTENRPPPSQ
jgi:hypothetical protein